MFEAEIFFVQARAAVPAFAVILAVESPTLLFVSVGAFAVIGAEFTEFHVLATIYLAHPNILTTFGDQNANIADAGVKVEASPDASVNQNGHSPQRQRGLKRLARESFSYLPREFTKREVVSILRDANPELTTINENTLSGIMRYFVAENLARVKAAASGRAAQIYEKI